MDAPDQPDFTRLRIVQIVAVLDGMTVLAIALWVMGQFSNPELAPIVISVALGAITFSAVFYFGCLIFAPALLKYIKEDRTVIKSETVEMVTDTYKSGDVQIDEWVNRFVFARNLFGMSVLPLLIFAWLWLFG